MYLIVLPNVGFGGGPFGQFAVQQKQNLDKIHGKPRIPLSIIRLKQKLIARAGTHALLSLGRLFALMDPDGDGVLTKHELRRGLEDFEIPMNMVELDEIFAHLDEDRNGFVSVEEFMRKIRGSLSERRQCMVKSAFTELVHRAHPANDCLSVDDLEIFYNPAWQPEVKEARLTEAEALREFVFQIGQIGQDKKVTLDNFLCYYTSVSPTCKTDQEFQNMLQSSWDVNLKTGTDEEAVSPARPEVEEPASQPQKGKSRTTAELPSFAKSKSLPPWVKYDRMVLNFYLYSLKPVSLYEGKFDHLSRELKSVETDSFVVQTFVLSYHVEDQTVTVHTTPNPDLAQSEAPQRFLSRCRLEEYVNLESFEIGKEIFIKGKRFVLYDAAKATRNFFKENLPQAYLGPALALPKAKAATQEHDKDRSAENHAAPHARKRTTEDKSLRPTRNFVENDGKILQFDCSWDDTSEYGEKRFFKLFFHMVDDTIELREVNRKNSGRERNALLNLRRDKLINPTSSNNNPRHYTWEDIKIGGQLFAFGRVLNVSGCNSFTRSFLNQHESKKEMEENSSESLSSIPPVPTYRLYSAEFQHVDRLLIAIKHRMEIHTNYATTAVQIRDLKAFLKMHSTREDPDKMSRNGFKQALARFSCFGSDAELLFDHVLKRNMKQTESLESGNQLVSIQSFVSYIYNSGLLQDPSPEIDSSLEIARSISPTPKLQGLLQALSAKLEGITNFADKGKQRRCFDKILSQYSREPALLTFGQLKGALSVLNCWDEDAAYLFASYKVSETHMNYKRLLYDVCESK